MELVDPLVLGLGRNGSVELLDMSASTSNQNSAHRSRTREDPLHEQPPKRILQN